MQKTLISFFLAFMPFLTAFPQYNTDQTPSDRKSSIHVEAGYIYPQGTIKESVSIRQNISYYYVNQYSNGYVSSETSGLVIGIRYEYFLPGLKSGISTGLRFTGLNTEISGYTSGNSNFFYLRYSMQDSDTKFARVNSLTESNSLISVPLEVRFIPFKYKNLAFYAKSGIEYTMIRFGKGTDIKFQNDDMDDYKDAILGSISGSPNKNYSTFYSSIGIKIGQEGKSNYMFEVLLPSFFLTVNNFALIDTDYFEGFKLAILFPIKNNK